MHPPALLTASSLCFLTGFVAAGITSAAAATNPPSSSFITADIALGAELLTGDTTYSIGYPAGSIGGVVEEGYFPVSELEWPLDVTLGRINANVRLGSSIRLSGTLKKNLSDPGDNMIDKDWITSYDPSQLDVYSESEIADFDALIWDINGSWNFLSAPLFMLYGGVGYQYQDFDYTGKLLHQYSPSGRPGFEASGDGSNGITYEMTYKMPYFLIGGDFQVIPALKITGSLAYSPWVDASDTDHHLLRDKTTVSDLEGDAYMLNASAMYTFAGSWFVQGGLNYVKIDVDGTQIQSFQGIPRNVVHQEAESRQTSLFCNIGYTF